MPRRRIKRIPPGTRQRSGRLTARALAAVRAGAVRLPGVGVGPAAVAARGAGPYGGRVQASRACPRCLDGVLWSGGGHGGVARAGLRVEVGARAAGSAQPRSCENKSSGAASPFWPLGSVLDAFPHRAHRNSGLYRRSRGSARSAVSTLVRLILNQTPLGGLRARPGARARPNRDRRDACKDLRETKAAPGCPYPGGQPPASRRVAFLAPWDLYLEAPRLGRGVAGLGRTYAGRVLTLRASQDRSELPRRR